MDIAGLNGTCETLYAMKMSISIRLSKDKPKIYGHDLQGVKDSRYFIGGPKTRPHKIKKHSQESF